MSTTAKTVEALVNREYEWGFVTDIEADVIPAGLNEDVVRLISSKKGEPEFMLEWRLRAFRHWVKMGTAAGEPTWANVTYPPIDYQSVVYYSAPKRKVTPGSLEEVDPKLLQTRSEEHTSELQSQFHLVCRLLLEKKKQKEIAAPRFCTRCTTPASIQRAPWQISLRILIARCRRRPTFPTLICSAQLSPQAHPALA